MAGESLTYHVDGSLVPADEATVSVRDRGFRFGDAALARVRAYGGALFEWEAHAARLRETCDALGVPRPPDDLRDRVEETLGANALDDALLAVSVTSGEADGLASAASDPTVVVAAESLPRGGTSGTRTWDAPAALQTVKTRRVPDRAVPARAKAHAHLNAVLARRELRAAAGPDGPADEALVRDADGAVVGGAATNLFLVADDALRTPALDSGPVYPGVTREVVVDLADDEGLSVAAGSYPPSDVRAADEAFLAGMRWELRPVAAVDGVEVGAGPVTELLSRLFDERIETDHYA